MKSGASTLALFLGMAAISPIQHAKAEARVMSDYNPAMSLAPLVEMMSPAVVNIVISSSARQMPQLPWGFPDPNWGQPSPNGKKKRETGQGSGFLISGDGYLLTNNHVIDGAEEVTVKLSNNKSYAGKIVGTDDSLDIALIKIEADTDLPFVNLGSSEALKVGDWVVAIGNPYGLSHTVTAGIVSAKSRDINAGPYDDFIQTDASINPGNSGGPLFNLKGEVIGINTAIDRRAQGIGFSVPIDSVKKILKDLKSEGKASRGWLGINLGQISPEGLREKGIDHGVLVKNVYRNTPARKAGMKDGDIILKIDGKKVSNAKSLIRRIGSYRANDNVKMHILRKNRKINLNVVLGKRPTEKEIVENSFNRNDFHDSLGIATAMAQGFNWNNPSQRGLVVTEIVKSSKAKGKLKRGDIIVKINGNNVLRRTDLDKHTTKGKKDLKLSVFRRGKQIKVIIKM